MDEIGVLPFRPWKGQVFMDEIWVLPFRPRKRPVFVDEIGIRGLVSVCFSVFLFRQKNYLCFLPSGGIISLIIAVRPIVSDGPGILHGEECSMNT